MAPILKGHQRFWGAIAVYGDYMPWGVHKAGGGDRSNFPPHSGKILDLKGGRDDAVTHFGAMIEPELPDNIVIATVPSHDPAKPGGGLKKLAATLARGGHRVDGSGCLVRHTKINKLAHGGDRSKEVHLNSISVTNAALIKNKDVFLLDDVTKSGNSLAACAELLRAAGARSVQCAAIGTT